MFPFNPLVISSVLCETKMEVHANSFLNYKAVTHQTTDHANGCLTAVCSAVAVNETACKYNREEIYSI